jgi:catechol 2,3-dioxygenase-like lactoylglutathione lyase family enzyme
MKKTFLLVLALVLVLSLAACGGKDNGGNNDPLNRDDGKTSSTAGTNTPAGNVPDLAGAIGGTGKLSELDPAAKQAMIDAAKADGGNLEFKADGSVVFTDADGSKSIQKPDGSWTFEDADGNKEDVQVGGDWPDNEFTKLLPKPDFSLMGATTEGDRFEVAFSGATVEQVKAYVEQVKAKGFTIDADTQDESVMGMTVYSYSAKNADEYRVDITFASGVAGLSIEKF